jgi:hypothetical protein
MTVCMRHNIHIHKTIGNQHFGLVFQTPRELSLTKNFNGEFPLNWLSVSGKLAHRSQDYIQCLQKVFSPLDFSQILLQPYSKIYFSLNLHTIPHDKAKTGLDILANLFKMILHLLNQMYL